MNHPGHLSDKAALKLALSDEERIQHVRKARWIGYQRANEILVKMEDLLSHPKQPRMPNLLIVGASNNGKSMLVDRFRARHPADANEEGPAVKVPVLAIQCPPGPDEGALYDIILGKLFQERVKRESVGAKLDRALMVLHKVDLGMILIDEIHNLIAGPVRKQRQFLNALKYLSNDLCVPFVALGTQDASRAMQSDEQMSNRFRPEILPQWSMGDDLLRLLASFESLLPLRSPSVLTSPELAKQILQMTNGTIGAISELLNAAAIFAIRSKQERIDMKALIASGYVQPGLRK